MKVVKPKNYEAFEADVVPAPVDDIGLATSPTDVDINKPDTEQEQPKQPITQSSSYTYFQGRPVRYSQVITSKFTINAGSSWDYPIIEDRKGILHHFVVAVNDEDMRVTVTYKDFDNNEFKLNYRTMKELSLIGRGITHGESQAAGGDDQSFDKSGFVHQTLPYLSRYKNTASGSDAEYDSYKGTDDDRWIALAFYPTNPLEFNSFKLDIENTRTDGQARFVHEVEAFIMYPLDDYPSIGTRVIGDPNNIATSIIGQNPQVQNIEGSLRSPIILTTNDSRRTVVDEGEADMLIG